MSRSRSVSICLTWIGAIDGRLGDSLVGFPRAGLEQVVIGHCAVVALAGLDRRLLALDEFFLGHRLRCVTSFSPRAHCCSQFSQSAFASRTGASAGGSSSWRGIASSRASCGLRIGEHRAADCQFGLQLPIVEPKQRIARLHFLADLAPSLRRRCPARGEPTEMFSVSGSTMPAPATVLRKRILGRLHGRRQLAACARAASARYFTENAISTMARIGRSKFGEHGCRLVNIARA